MMLAHRALLLLITAPAIAASAGCSSSSGSSGTTADAGSTSSGSGSDSSSGSGSGSNSSSGSSSGSGSNSSGTDAGKQQAFLRVAHLSPDAPAVDLCVAPHGTTTFTGPLLKDAGDTSGLSFGQVTKYDAVPAVQYDVRIVAPNAADCSTSLAGLPDFTMLPALPGGSYVTVAALGDVQPAGSDPSFGLTAFIDDGALSNASDGAIRFVHASPGTPAVDVGLGTGSSFMAVFQDVSFGHVAAKGGPIDANGYYVGAPFNGQTVTARVHGMSEDALTVPNVSLPAGAIATAFAVGGKTGDTAHPLKVLLCVDNAQPSGLLSNCN